MNNGHPPYEIRYGWNTRTLALAAAFLLLTASPLVPGAPLWDETALAVIGLACLTVTSVTAFSHQVAFRAGPEGLTLGGSPFGLKPEHIAWPDVASVDLWSEPLRRFARMPHIGVRHRTGPAAPWSRPASPALRRIDDYLLTQVDPEFLKTFHGTVLSSRAMALWHLNPTELQSALNAYAPHVHFFGSGTQPKSP